MKHAVICLLTSVVLVGCSSGSSSSGLPPPSACKQTDRTGTYLLTWTEQSGDCGKIDPGLVSLNQQSGNGGSGACQIHSDVWSENDCKNERTATCITRVNDPSQYGGYGSITNDAVAVTRQETADGSRLDGTISMSLSASDGTTCRGTYAVVYVRQ